MALSLLWVLLTAPVTPAVCPVPGGPTHTALPCAQCHPTPGHPTPGQPTPGELTPGQPTPGEPTPGELTPGELTPGELTPGELTPCDACHARPHALFGRCSDCHRPPTPFRETSVKHDAWPLRGAHQVVACAACHPREGRAAQPDCAACHRDPHGGRAGLDCAGCHTPVDWLGVLFRHDETGFPLQGRHLTVPCRDCHRGDRFVGQPDPCLFCHGEDLPRSHQFPGARHCAECHDARSFAAPGFVHRPSVATGGVHARVARDCGRCHTGARPLDAEDCLGCHTRDLSAGHQAFLRDAADARDCLACHARAAPWTAVRFSHPGGLLTGGHLGVPCSSCHPLPPSIKSGAERCRGCHLRHQPTQDHPRTRDCVDCHSTAAFYPALFR